MTDAGEPKAPRFSTGKLLVLAVLALLLLAGLMTLVSRRNGPTYRITAYLQIKTAAEPPSLSEPYQASQIARLQQLLPSGTHLDFPGGGEVLEIRLDGRKESGDEDLRAIESAIAAYVDDNQQKQSNDAPDAKGSPTPTPPKVEVRVIQPPRLTPIISRFPF